MNPVQVQRTVMFTGDFKSFFNLISDFSDFPT